ncbi:MAG: ribulose-phosphate 3-epimerase [Candidatus Hydrogenedentes bacterium]|nr:ribulose-phosphate 3-epimerase [Candidatus Hydrogenedentota bacterium]
MVISHKNTIAPHNISIEIGIKTDPVTYRYSYPWLFKFMQRHGLHHVQLGTFVELYQLPDKWFEGLREEADSYEISISSVFTSHRELGGFFRDEPGLNEVAYRNFARLIEVGGLLGASCVGGNPGAVLRDQMDTKAAGVQRYFEAMKKLMHHGWRCGVETLTFEPMSCTAEPPTSSDEIRNFADTLDTYHRNTPETSAIGICFDTSHGYADEEGIVRVKPAALLEASLPWLAEMHLKNTDDMYCSTFGFGEMEQVRGIIELDTVRDMLYRNADQLPHPHLIAYLNVDGPNLGRDYSDKMLEQELEASILHLQSIFSSPDRPYKAGNPITVRPSSLDKNTAPLPVPDKEVFVAFSLEAADLTHLETDIRSLELAGVEYLHLDIMDAHFAPNMPLGLETARQLRAGTSLPFDAHLMVDLNDFFIRQVNELGANMVSVHVESCSHLDRALALIRAFGMRAGVAMNPAAPLQVLDYILERLDFVLLMTVNPGFTGQRITPASLKKIAACRDYLQERGAAIPIQVDGNVSFDNIVPMVAAGADILVAGASCVYDSDAGILENMAQVRTLAAQGLSERTSK